MSKISLILQSDKLYLCNYPFLFDAEAKTLLLQTDQAIQMQTAMNEAATRALFSFLTSLRNDISQYLVLNVSRENLVLDTLRELTEMNTNDLKKPLKVGTVAYCIFQMKYSTLHMYLSGEVSWRRSG